MVLVLECKVWTVDGTMRDRQRDGQETDALPYCDRDDQRNSITTIANHIERTGNCSSKATRESAGRHRPYQ